MIGLNRTRLWRWLAVVAVAGLVSARAEKPNIILVLADDLGFSDIGCYGSEIDTPNLDRLGREGVRFTQFYNSARCCPTRASLMTGLHPHEAVHWSPASAPLHTSPM